jgi:beta-glucosidase
MAQITFPKQFLWGAATAAYQIEGAVKEDGRGETIWDRFSHTPGKTLNGDTGDIACDHYHRYREDIALMKKLGLKGYRFSVAWSRIFPDGKGNVNQRGIDFYQSLVDELLTAGIEPAVTLYHWDLPQALQDKGGWANRDTTDYFTDYAVVLFKTFGDRVKKWITHNEPICAAFVGNASGEHAPGFHDDSLAVQVSHHLLLSHAKAVQAFRQLNSPDGKIGITLVLTPVHPASNSPEDQAVALMVDGSKNRWFLDPVFKGSYPEDVLKLYQEKLNSPIIQPSDMKLMASQKIDFLGLNYYFRTVAQYAKQEQPVPFVQINPVGSSYTEMGWEVYPQGIYELLTRVKSEYGDLPIYITENGAAYRDEQITDGQVVDDDRIDYLKQHFEAAFRAIQAGVKLEGYFVWSLMDNFEWAHGYSKRFGLVRVDFETLARNWKKSAYWYRDVIKNNGL